MSSSIQAQSVALQAAADFSGPGALEVPVFERDITDMIRRTSIVLDRIRKVPATGHPHRYFEQLAIAQGSANDPRALAPAPTNPQRVERAAFIKAVTAQTNFGLFDTEVTQQQGQFAILRAKDMDDILSAITLKRANMLWAGTDTSLVQPTTLEWQGALTQITQTAVITQSASIVDGLKTVVANMVANKQFVVRPTAIVCNPLLIDLIEKEMKAQHLELASVNLAGGVSVKAINTQVGALPLIGDQFMPDEANPGNSFGLGAAPSGQTNYYAAVISEDMIEMPYIGSPNARLFQLGLLAALQGQFVGVQFDALVVKGYAYAHTVVAVQR